MEQNMGGGELKIIQMKVHPIFIRGDWTDIEKNHGF